MQPDQGEGSSDSVPLVDMDTFGQLLEMDDDEEHTFSKSLTWDYFDQVSDLAGSRWFRVRSDRALVVGCSQAVTTIDEMDHAV